MINELFHLLTSRQRKQFYILQLLVLIMTFSELIGIASIAPFMALVGDIDLLKQGGIFTKIYQFSGLKNPTDFLFYTGLSVLFMLSISAILSSYTSWKLSLYGAMVGTEIADRLYTYYMQQDWLFYATGSSAFFTKQVSVESSRVTNQIIQPLMHLSAKIVLAFFISVSLFIFNPVIAAIGLLLFSGAYILLYKIVRTHLQINGASMSRIFSQRFSLMNEGFGGIKDVLLLNRHHDFIARFQQSGKDFARANGVNDAITIVPRYFMELLVFGAMIGLLLVLIKMNQGNLGMVMPVLAVYAMASFKLLPALQQIYANITLIKGNSAAFEAIKKELEGSRKLPLNKQNPDELLPVKQQISLEDITFSYPGKTFSAINQLSMIIPANNIIGLVGSSGSGKSTVIDLLLGLLEPQKGALCVDGIRIDSHNKRAWQNNIGFVPQSIFLSEGTIAENVAFGLPHSDINLEQVKKVIKLAHLNEVVENLPNGLATKVGERGVQLSGGQRQRIGIARALYNEADVLIFDEATSALDGISEKIIMEAIHDFNGQKTIILIAHRLKTIQNCDMIYLMQNGQITAQGTYDELLENNILFKEMAVHA